ncbi:NAD(P)H-binding protein [Labedaea rhizosphaerae]|uniref:NAD(P)H-binding protein n=1 Tax=Labedaea rhizosphaerae TaxID=598644 RepID=UPI001060F45C|nr:NAD(P)H-binding protein [Labedaea rhizosphaerae]
MIVVTGASGNVGQPLVQALVEAGEEVTAVARKPVELPGARFRQADLTEPDTLVPVLDGADALFLLTPPDFLAHGDLPAVLAVASRVERVVFLSSQGVATGRHPSHLEAAVKSSGLAWTILRPGNFASNALQWAATVRAERVVAAPFGDVALPAVDPRDIAEVAAVALCQDGHVGNHYTLTGPEPISPRQQAATIGDALGEPVRFVELSRTQARERMLTVMPEPVADVTLDILGAPTAVEQQVSPDVERVLGRPPRPFAEWMAGNTAAFR